MNLAIYQVDAFTDRPFGGNPAAVCIVNEELADSLMQDIAAEMNLSETAFVSPGNGDFSLRWFTPTTEVQLCGHATLAAAHVLWKEGHASADEVLEFNTRSGKLSARLNGDLVELDFPAESGREAEPPAQLLQALAVDPVYVGKNRFDYLVEVQSASTLRDMEPDFALLETLKMRGVIVTAESDREDWDFISRFFAPAVGVDEDPVTGSAHCFLGPYWSRKLKRSSLTGYQASERGGTVSVRPEGQRVILGGQAVTVMRGKLSLPCC